jgi:hypothetical protein
MLAAGASEAQASQEAAATIIPVQEMPRPNNLVNADVAKGLAPVCPDEQV